MAKAPDYGSYIPDANDPVFVTQAKAAQLAKEQPLYASGQGTPIFNNPGGIDGYVQFNSASSFGGDVGFTYNNKTRSVNILGNLNVGGFLNSKFYTNFSNLRISGGSEGDVIFTDGEGNLSWGNLDNYTTNAELTARFTAFQQGNVNFTGANVSLGNVSNLHISGGSPNFILSTDGAGNLSWIEETGGGPNRFSIYNGTSNVAVPDTDGNVFVNVNDEYQWVYNTDGELLAGGQFVALQGELTDGAGYTFDETSRDTGMYSDSDGQLKFKANDKLVAFYTDNDVHLYTKSADYLTTYDWHLDRTGNLTLPTSGAINYSNGVSILSGLGGDSFDQSLNTDDDVTFNSVGATTVNVSQINGTNPGDELIIQANNLNWTFGTEGNLTLPSNTARINYANGTNILDGLGGDGTGLSASDFGEGFSLTASNKIVTNKLYSTNETQPTQHYRLELDTNGVVVLPDGSIINGSTIRGVAGTGELNYTGITIGPNSGDAEKTWMWVDHANAYISTNNFVNTWTFDNNGNFILPVDGDILDSTGNSVLGISPSVPRSDTAPVAANGQLWFNTLEGRMYIKYDGAWVDAAPLMTPAPELNPEFSTITFPDASVQTTAALGDRLVNGNREVVLNSNGSLLVAEDIILPQTGRIIKDCNNSGGTTSQRWVNIPTDTEVELIRAYTGDPDASGGLDVERAKISVEWQTPDKTGLSIAAFDDGDEYKWEFNGDGTTQFPDGIIKAPPGDNTISMQSQNSKNFVTVSDGQVLITAENTTAYNWAFGTNGVLTLPSSSYVESSDNNLKVGAQGSVTIRSNAAGGAGLKAWTFGTDGTTQFPTNMSIDYSGGNVQFPRIIADSGKAFSVQGQGNTGSAALAWTVDPNTASQYASVGVTKGGGDNLAKVVLQAQSNSGDAGTTKTWQFNETGTTKFPDGTILAPAGQTIIMQSDQNSQLLYQNANIAEAPNVPTNTTFAVQPNFATLVVGYRDGNSEEQDNTWLWNIDGMTLPEGGTITEGGGLTGAIRLTPAGGDNSNQALLIYPTAGAPDGDHIHLTAGGGSTELYLGNDLHYVKLVDGGNIELRATTANLSSQAAWTFDTTGNVDTIQALGIKVPNGVPSNIAVINSTTGSWEANPRSNLATTGGSGSGLTVNVTETGGNASTIAIATAGTGYNNGDLITVTSGSSNATFTIVIGGRNTWQFGTDGNLTVPGSFINDTSIVLSAPAIFNICTISTAGSGYNTGSSLKATTGGSGTGMTVGIGYGLSNQLTNVDVVDPGTGYVDGDVITVSGGTGGTFVITKYNQLANQANNNTIQTDFAFANNTVTLPIYGEIATNASMTLTTNLANTGNTNSWTFGTDGNLTLPGNLRFPNGANIAVPSGTPRTNAIAITNATELLIGTNTATTSSLWTFGIDGSTIFPDNTVKGYCFTTTNIVTNYIPQSAAFMYTDSPILSLISTIGGTWYIKGPGLVGWKQITSVQDNGGVALIVRIGSGAGPMGDGSEFHSGGYLPTSPDLVYTISQYLEFDLTVTDKTWMFDKDGNITLPTNTSAINYANGQSILDGLGGGSSYGNSNVANYLPTHTGNVSANYFLGNVAGGNVSITGQMNVSGTITSNFIPQSNITYSLGNSTNRWKDIYLASSTVYLGNVQLSEGAGNSLSVLGNVTTTGTVYTSDLVATSISTTGGLSVAGGNILTSGGVYANFAVSTQGNVTGNYFIGNGSQLTDITVSTATTAATVTTNAQPNITSVGTLSGLTVGPNSSIVLSGTSGYVKANSLQGTDGTQTIYLKYGSVAGAAGIATDLTVGTTGTGNLTANGTISASGNITGNYILGNGSQLTGITATSATTAATVTTNAQPNITSVGTLSSLSISGNITSGNILTGGLLSATGNITGGNLITSGLLTVAGNISAGGNIIGASSNVSLVAGSYTWTFDNTSNAAFPGNLSATSNIRSNASFIATNVSGTISIGNTNSFMMGIGNANNYVQSYVHNQSNTSEASADMIVYGSSGTNDLGFMDMGMTSNNFSSSFFTVTGKSEGYMFMSGVAGTSGNMVIATNSTGSNNSIEFYVGGFSSAKGANRPLLVSNTGISVTGNITGNTNGFAIGYRDVPQVAASNATIGLTDAGKHFYSTTAGNFTLTIPNNATTTFSTGTAISIVVQAAGNILVNAASGVTLYMAGNSTAANRVVGTYGMATIMKVASDTWFINGTGVS